MPSSIATGLDPPKTPREVITDVCHGHEIADPFRWLEASTSTVQEWANRQNDYVDACLATPTRDRLRETFGDLAATPRYGGVVARGGRYFQALGRPDADHDVLCMRTAHDADPTVLVDPNTWPANGAGGSSPRSIGWHVPSPDGEYVAYGVTTGGDEHYAIHVRSVPCEGKYAVIPDCGRVNTAEVAWGPDSDGIYFLASDSVGDGGQLNVELRHWTVDGGEQTMLESKEGYPAQMIRTDPDTGTVAVGFFDVGAGSDWFVLDDGQLRPVLTGTGRKTEPVFLDGRVYLRTDHEAPRFRVLGCPVDRFRAGDLSYGACETIIPEREAVLQSVVPTATRLVTHYHRNAHSVLSVYSSRGGHVRDIPLPEYASVSHLHGHRRKDEVLYRHSSFVNQPSVVRVSTESTGRKTVSAGTVDVPDRLVVRQTFVESTGGAVVPVFICHLAGLPRDGTNPAVLNGYGGFRKTMTPTFDRFRLPFLAAGGVYAQVCARGGHAYGEEWHEAGMRENKQHTFDDFIAAGEFLRDAGYTSPANLALTGGSNGGLSVGAVLTQRPTLWAAAVCRLPLLDMLRFHHFLLGEGWTTEYGSPEDPEAFEVLREYSPYHNVDPDDTYPPVLFTTADGDTRVHPCHAYKMTARLQTEANGGPFLVRTMADAGHGEGTTTSVRVERAATKWAFIAECLQIELCGSGSLSGKGGRGPEHLPDWPPWMDP